jgi:hypothetical protein
MLQEIQTERLPAAKAAFIFAAAARLKGVP